MSKHNEYITQARGKWFDRRIKEYRRKQKGVPYKKYIEHCKAAGKYFAVTLDQLLAPCVLSNTCTVS